MHVMLSWDINAAEPRWGTINDALVAQLKPYPWVRPLKTVYVVTIQGEAQRAQLNESLASVGKTAGTRVDILISPVMSGGAYNGLLPTDYWKDINSRAT